jgi:hypothetical protein
MLFSLVIGHVDFFLSRWHSGVRFDRFSTVVRPFST